MTAGATPLRVLFVCTANICRSPFMELLARQQVGDALAVSSAGTRGSTDHPMSEEMADRLRERGISPDGFRSRPLTGELVEEADLVLTAEAAHRAFALDEWPAAFRRIFTLGQFAAAVRARGRPRSHRARAARPPRRPPRPRRPGPRRGRPLPPRSRGGRAVRNRN